MWTTREFACVTVWVFSLENCSRLQVASPCKILLKSCSFASYFAPKVKSLSFQLFLLLQLISSLQITKDWPFSHLWKTLNCIMSFRNLIKNMNSMVCMLWKVNRKSTYYSLLSVLVSLLSIYWHLFLCSRKGKHIVAALSVCPSGTLSGE